MNIPCPIVAYCFKNIQAIAFAGLLASSEMALNQFGFMLCVAVLVDTFVVRTLVVPAMMQLAGSRNWWPGKVMTIMWRW